MTTFAVIGFPLDHTLSPTFHNYLFDRLGLDARYRALETTPGELGKVAQQLRDGALTGINITRPHKTAFLAYLDRIAPEAIPVGAVNCVAMDRGELVGYNTDLAGLTYALTGANFPIAGSRVLLLGAGGAARAALTVLRQQGAAQICVAGRRVVSVQQFIGSFPRDGGVTTLKAEQLDAALDTTPYQLIINATPVGLWPQTDAAVLVEDQLHRGQTVLDMVYHPENTLLLQRAKAQGGRIIPGLEMFIGQGLASLRHWFPGVLAHDNGLGNIPSDFQVSALKTVLLTALENHATETQPARLSADRP